MTTPRKITTLLFDWDGTLADSSHRSFVAFERSFRDLGIAFTREIYDIYYAPNAHLMYEALNLPTERWPQANDLWIQHYGQEPTELVPDARETLLSLYRKGYRLGVVSSGSRQRVIREIDELNLSSVFGVVVCSEDVENKKPHPEGLEKAMAFFEAGKESCSYIGDAPEDIRMGHNADILTVAVPSSFPSSKNLHGANPDIHLASIKELLVHF